MEDKFTPDWINENTSPGLGGHFAIFTFSTDDGHQQEWDVISYGDGVNFIVTDPDYYDHRVMNWDEFLVELQENGANRLENVRLV